MKKNVNSAAKPTEMNPQYVASDAGKRSIPAVRHYPIYRDFPEHLIRRLDDAINNDQLKSWADTVYAVPRHTSYITDPTGTSIRAARKIWDENIVGNPEILNVLLRHCVEYGKTGQTSAILLVGPPGVGKTLVAKTYAQMLQLPFQKVFRYTAAINRGLAGVANVYAGDGPGAIVQAMIEAKIGNPVICIDGLDRLSASFGTAPTFRNEFLSALDTSPERWYDNYIEMDVDISHIPFIFTANSFQSIPQPLLDCVEIVEMTPPSKQMLYDITFKHLLPKGLSTYGSDRIRISEPTVQLLVDRLWIEGNTSGRLYQKAVELLIGNAFVTVLENDEAVTVTEQDIQQIFRQSFLEDRPKTIGFLSA